MNRIVIVGNGFDLAHGLKTSYKDFIDWYWEQRWNNLYDENNEMDNDPLLNLSELKGIIRRRYDTHTGNRLIASSQQLKNEICALNEIVKDSIYSSPLFRKINSSIRVKGWIDIENEYYNFLSKKQRSLGTYSNPDILNQELDFLKEKLIDYLNDIQKSFINEKISQSIIKQIILEPIHQQDIAINNKEEWNFFKKNRFESKKEEWKKLYENYNLNFSEIERYFIRDRYGDGYKLWFSDGTPKEAFVPDHIQILNFNYTNTADHYLPKADIFTVNHIHGELEHPESVIFGYGDELDEHYKELVNKNENAYLQNIKSIKYLESDRYRKLLEFIESDTYQIYIMGHSCGNSDRTLLHTLFEHPNCVSIKPFYYKRKDGTDNYTEIVQNISRNFTHMQRMRDVVVNKTYCQPFSIEI